MASKIINETGLDKLSKQIVAELAKSQTILLFSYDIVGSTAYKTKNPDSWKETFTKIFKKLEEYITFPLGRVPNSFVWKTLGDEIIFCVPVESVNHLSETIKTLYSILQVICTYIEESDSIVLKDYLSVKGTAWIAKVDNKYVADKTNIFEYVDKLFYHSFEFTGPDIDSGFRIAKSTEKKQLVISIELALILLKYKATCENVYLMSFERYKGVWNDKEYPVLFYFTKLGNYSDINEIEDRFDEDSKFSDEYYRNRYAEINTGKNLQKYLKEIVANNQPTVARKTKDIIKNMHKNELWTYSTVRKVRRKTTSETTK